MWHVPHWRCRVQANDVSSRNAAARAIEATGAMGSVAELGAGRAAGFVSWASVDPDRATIMIARRAPMDTPNCAGLPRTW